MKKCVELSLISLGTLKYDCVTKHLFYFLPLIKNLAITGFSFLVLIKSTIISSKTIHTLRFFPRLYSSIKALRSS